jgi:hypothetical protein
MGTRNLDIQSTTNTLKALHETRELTVIPLRVGEKLPTSKCKDWSTKRIDNNTISKHGGNFGITLDAGVLVIDFDPKNAPDYNETEHGEGYGYAYTPPPTDENPKPDLRICLNVFKQLEEGIKITLPLHVMSQGGGHHTYLKLSTDTPANLKSVVELLKASTHVEAYGNAVEFFTSGRYMVAPSSCISYSNGEKRYYTFADGASIDNLVPATMDDAPVELLKLLAEEVHGTTLNSNVKTNLTGEHVEWFEDLDNPYAPKLSQEELEYINEMCGAPVLREEDVQKHLSRMRGKDAYEYHMWFKIAAALYHWSTQSDDNDGFKLFNEWSAKDENKGDDKGYSEKACKGTWERVIGWYDKKAGNKITIGSLIFEANKLRTDAEIKEDDAADFDRNQAELESFKQRIADADKKTLQVDVIPAIKKAGIPEDAREVLAYVLKDHYKDEFGEKLSIIIARAMVSKGVDLDTEELNGLEELRKICYVANDDEYVHTETGAVYNATRLNETFRTGTKSVATQLRAATGIGYNVFKCEYRANLKDEMFFKGMPYKGIEQDALNSFHKSTLAVDKDLRTLSDLEKQAINHIVIHVNALLKNNDDLATKRNVEILFGWMCRVVTNIGEIIRWGVLLVGKPGLGKTFIHDVLSLIVGRSNSTVVSPDVANSTFTGFAENHLIACLEEVDLSNVARYNALKSFVTNTIVNVVDKNEKAHDVVNQTNYILTTNNKASVPFSKGDRRFAPFNILHDEAGLIAEVNRLNRLRGTDDIRPFPDMHVKDCLNSNDYFERLYRGYGMQESNGKENVRNAIYSWLKTTYANVDGVSGSGRPPETSDLLSFEGYTQDGKEGYAEVQELLEQGGDLYNKEFVNITALSSDIGATLSIPKLKALIRDEFGFEKMGSPRIVAGGKLRFWAKDNINASSDDIKASLLKTKNGNAHQPTVNKNNSQMFNDEVDNKSTAISQAEKMNMF